MRIYSKNTMQCLMILISLPVFFTSFKANAARYSAENGLSREEFNFNIDDLYEERVVVDSDQFVDKVKSNYQLVFGLVKQKKYTQAKEKVASLILQYPSEAAYYNMKAALEISDRNLAMAQQSFQKAIELDAGNAKAYIGLARLAASGEQHTQAKKYAKKALEITPYSVDAYKVLIQIAMQEQRFDDVEKTLLDANNKVKGNLNAELVIVKLLGDVYSKKKQPKKILHLAENLVDRNYGDSAALSNLAEAQLLNQDTVGGEKTLRQLIVQEPKEAKYRVLLAKLLSTQAGKEVEVLQLLDQAAIDAESPVMALSIKTSFLIQQKKYQQALAVARQVNRSYPQVTSGKILIGDVYLAEKKYKQALQSYQQAYKMMPNTQVLDVILNILTVQNKQEDIVELLENELAKNKDFTQIQYRLAGAYQKAGNYDLSIKHYEALLAKKENNVIVFNNLAWAYSQQKNPKALKFAEKAYQKAPKSAVIVDTYGYVLLKNGNIKEGLKMLQKAVGLAPNLAEIQLHLAEAYSANRNKAKAREILQQLVVKNGAEKAAALKLMEQL